MLSPGESMLNSPIRIHLKPIKFIILTAKVTLGSRSVWAFCKFFNKFFKWIYEIIVISACIPIFFFLCYILSEWLLSIDIWALSILSIKLVGLNLNWCPSSQARLRRAHFFCSGYGAVKGIGYGGGREVNWGEVHEYQD